MKDKLDRIYNKVGGLFLTKSEMSKYLRREKEVRKQEVAVYDFVSLVQKKIYVMEQNKICDLLCYVFPNQKAQPTVGYSLLCQEKFALWQHFCLLV